MNASGTEILGPRWVKGDRVLQDRPPHRTTQSQGLLHFLSELRQNHQRGCEWPPKIKAARKSGHATNGETAVLACKSVFPRRHPWVWHRMCDQALTNHSRNKSVLPSEARTELHTGA